MYIVLASRVFDGKNQDRVFIVKTPEKAVEVQNRFRDWGWRATYNEARPQVNEPDVLGTSFA